MGTTVRRKFKLIKVCALRRFACVALVQSWLCSYLISKSVQLRVSSHIARQIQSRKILVRQELDMPKNPSMSGKVLHVVTWLAPELLSSIHSFPPCLLAYRNFYSARNTRAILIALETHAGLFQTLNVCF